MKQSCACIWFYLPPLVRVIEKKFPRLTLKSISIMIQPQKIHNHKKTKYLLLTLTLTLTSTGTSFFLGRFGVEQSIIVALEACLALFDITFFQLLQNGSVTRRWSCMPKLHAVSATLFSLDFCIGCLQYVFFAIVYEESHHYMQSHSLRVILWEVCFTVTTLFLNLWPGRWLVLD